MYSDRTYMRRALQLAALGEGTVWSNPMVGAVIVAPDGRIIGEGWHRRYGEGHAEVNAVASVSGSDRPLLPHSTIYVTLEPCSHYGKTPPCSRLLIDRGLRRVVVGTTDPFAKVCGRGLSMLRDAGCDVEVGVLADECAALNVKFFTAHRLHRPFVLLKWAQTADGYMGVPGERLQISNPASAMEVHRLRSRYQAILAGSGTILADDPLLDTRLWPMGRTPRRITVDRSGRIPADSRFFRPDGAAEAIYVTSPDTRRSLPAEITALRINSGDNPAELLGALYSQGIISLMVEGGADMLRSFLDSGLWDAARIETNPRLRLNGRRGIPAPTLAQPPAATHTLEGNIIQILTNRPDIDVKNL